ncbi:surface antigen [Plasmodium falciparum UGT5.1]|uniref:Surface antigen n=2 Tax=Plasmodium (Laverania) TaxID=418107 RepID=W7JCD4_PLAFA|nr:surface antigen [Plasmodium falciparum UGT5.1]
MKLHYTKILLFFFPLNILVTSYHAHNNKNKPSITPRYTQRYTSRVLSKCDIRSSVYDNDAKMKSVKENFDRQTSQRFDEYEERMKGKRRKRKEERDKNIQEIIEKDRMHKLLAEKVEKGCLKYGCGLGGVAASVGLFGGFGIYGWKSAALAAVKNAALAECAEAGKNVVISGIIEKFGVSTMGEQALKTFFTATNYTDVSNISHLIYSQYETTCISLSSATVGPEPICISVWENLLAGFGGKGELFKEIRIIEKTVKTIVSSAEKAAGEALEKATEGVIKTSTATIESTYTSLQIAIIASVVALLIIALVMIIIYLVLRYRRKKKMNKKAHYTKLLNQKIYSFKRLNPFLCFMSSRCLNT